MEKVIANYAYCMDDRLGSGAFGEVYKGRNTETNEKVAIKVMNKRNRSFNVEQVKKECGLMSQFNSPHIVQYLFSCETTNNFYVIIELCTGGDLRQLLSKNPQGLCEEDAINIIEQLVKGFKCMHQHKILHRDIKPDNVLVNDGVYKLADLGLSREYDSNRMMQSMCGTPLYMSPQILFNKPYTDKADVYSLGLMFYEILYGRPPWVIRDMITLQKAILNAPLRFFYDKKVSQETQNFIRKCMAREENDRFSWEEVFQHQLFNSRRLQRKPTNEFYKKYEIGAQAKKIFSNLQNIAQDQQPGFVKIVFQNFDKDGCGMLNQQEFYEFLRKIDKQLTHESSDMIFTLIDTDGSGGISFDEFEVIFDGFDFNDIDDPTYIILRDIRAIVHANNYNLEDWFKKFDIHQLGALDQVGFEFFVKAVIPNISQSDAFALFKKFDINGDGDVTFEEFYDVIQNKQKTKARSRSNSQNQQSIGSKQSLGSSNQISRKNSVTQPSSISPYQQEQYDSCSQSKCGYQKMETKTVEVTPQPNSDFPQMSYQAPSDKDQHIAELQQKIQKLELLNTQNTTALRMKDVEISQKNETIYFLRKELKLI